MHRSNGSNGSSGRRSPAPASRESSWAPVPTAWMRPSWTIWPTSPEATAARGVAVGAHFILGLPDESDTELLDRTRIINALPLATVKFHQLQFVEGTRMTDLYDAEPARFRRWTAAEYVDLTAEILRRLRPDIAVERIAGQTPPRIRCRRPWGNLRGDALWRMLEKRLVEKNAHQGEFFVSSQR